MNLSSITLNDISSKVKTTTDSMYSYALQSPVQTSVICGIFSYFTGKYIYHKLYQWYYKLPPGPFSSIPIIGHTLSTIFNSKWHLEWAMKYGQIYTFYQLNIVNVMINDAKIARQILTKSYAQDRDLTSTGAKPEDRGNFNLFAAEDNTPSFINLNGKQWSTMRQLVHSKLVRVMNTKYVNDIMASVIRNEFEPKLNKIVNSKNDKKWYCREALSQLTFNIIFKANFGKNVDFENNPICKELARDLIDSLGWNIAKRNVFLLLLPKLSPAIIPKFYFQPVYDLKQRLIGNIKKLIQQRKLMEKKSNWHNEDVTFMDHTQELIGTKDREYTESQEMADIILLFLAGTDTTSISTEWGLLLLSRQPEIQKKVRNELISVLDKNDIDYKSDPVNVLYDIKLLLQLPLFRACVHEILRISCVARTGVPHSTQRDIPITTNNGKKYTIPAGTKIFYNVEGIHYNINGDQEWKNEEYGLNYQQICLENWLKDDEESGERKFYQNPSFMTFGYGKRVKYLLYFSGCVYMEYSILNIECSML